MIRLIVQVAILSTMILGGCVALAPIPLTQPYFVVGPEESKWFQALTRKQEDVVAKCSETISCDHAYFVRALLGLYESREIAVKYFGKVIAVAPKGQLAVSSRAWMQLLQQHPAPASISWTDAVISAPVIADTNKSLAQAAERLVRDLLDREGVIQQLRSIKQEDDSQTVELLQRELADRDRRLESLSKRVESASVHGLHKQLAERDRKIEELSTQLEALKRIDQEMREKVRPIRPPSTTAPVPAPDATP